MLPNITSAKLKETVSELEQRKNDLLQQLESFDKVIAYYRSQLPEAEGVAVHRENGVAEKKPRGRRKKEVSSVVNTVALEENTGKKTGKKGKKKEVTNEKPVKRTRKPKSETELATPMSEKLIEILGKSNTFLRMPVIFDEVRSIYTSKSDSTLKQELSGKLSEMKKEGSIACIWNGSLKQVFWGKKELMQNGRILAEGFESFYAKD
jgi:hypothetical protein